MSFYEGKKVLIPGGAGLAGSALIRQLVPLGAKVTATEYKHRRIDQQYASKIKVYQKVNLLTADLAELYAGQDIVFWCGAMVGGAKHISVAANVDDMIHGNLYMAMRNILAAVRAGVKRFGYISSSYVYPETTLPANEQDVGLGDAPLNIYGLSWIKRYTETVCRHHHMTSNTRFALVRPTAYYGPNDSFDLETCHALPAFIKRFSDGGTIELWGNGQERRQFTYVDDLADGLLRVTEDYAVCDPINIATDEIHTIADVATKVAILTNTPKLNWYFTYDGPTAIQDRLVSTYKAKRLLGFKCKTSLDEGLQKTLDWYKENSNES